MAETSTCDGLIDYINGHLTDDEAKAFRDHIATCKRCDQNLLTDMQIMAALSTLEPDRAGS